MSEVLSLTTLRTLVDEWIADGRRVAGPRLVNDRLLYAWLDSAGQLALDGETRPRETSVGNALRGVPDGSSPSSTRNATEGVPYSRDLHAEIVQGYRWGEVRPRNSIKEFLFPRHEELYGYKLGRKRVELTEIAPPQAEQIVIAARPCDAALGPILDHVFNWDYADATYNRRRELTTIVTVACRSFDAQCFCTSVGSGPEDPRGSDAMLYALDEGILEIRCLTEKGRRLFAGHTDPSDLTAPVSAGPERRFDLDKVGRFLESGFEDSQWPDLARRCLGCGTCAYTCPTCHCFDIVDEGAGGQGVRARNWDSCQFAQFTLHASGHNPRSQQAQRQRQRIYHKFRIYPQKFGTLLCTGCGNCTRNCPVGLGVRPLLSTISQAERNE